MSTPQPAPPLQRYGRVAQLFHWVTAILVVVAFVYGPGGSEARVYLPERNFERSLHETLGLCVFALAWARLLWRSFDTRPEEIPMPARMRLASKAAQGALYLLLIAVPLTAIVGAWLEGHPLTLINGTDIAPMLAPSHDLGAQISELHTWLGDAILWIAGLHAGAAIYHHVFVKDGVLLSMLPNWFPLRQR